MGHGENNRKKKMKIQFMSDLHLEFAENSRYIKHNEFPATGDVLVLAGDTYLRMNISPMDLTLVRQ